MSHDSTLDRRTFLQNLGAASVCAGAASLSGCGGGNGTQSTDTFSAGETSSYTAPIWRLFTDHTTIVALDSTGFFAYTNICTHAGCQIGFADPVPSDPTMNTSANGLTICPCHGSTYDGNGAVMMGPATEPLAHFDVTIANGTVTVNPAVVVAASTRTPS